MLLHPAQAFVQFADQHTVPDGGGMILDDSTVHMGNTITQTLLHQNQIRSHISAQRVHFRTNIGNVILDLGWGWVNTIQF